MAEGTCSISMWARATSPCTQGSKVSAEQARLRALGREEGEDRSWGHENCKPRGLCSPISEKQALLLDEVQPSALADSAQSLQGFQLLPSSS